MGLDEMIANAGAGDDIDVSAYASVYATVRFTHGNLGFTYVVRNKRGGLVFPTMANKWDVKFWKKLDGAKKYFLKSTTRISDDANV
jgi:hypothetical protein